MMPHATVLIPTWNAPDTLGAALQSARRQTVADIEILVVSDGATGDTLAVATEHALSDARVRILDLPKAEARGEANRHQGVLAARSEAIIYLADDDLLLPEHVEYLTAALATHDLVQSRNTFIDRDDQFRLLLADLGDPRWHEWHRADPPLNRISITGTGHTRVAYMRLASGWVVPTPPMPADLTLWRQFLDLEGLRAVTLPHVTALQFPAPERRAAGEELFAARRVRWEAIAASDGGFAAVNDLAERAKDAELMRAGLEFRRLVTDIRDLQDLLAARGWRRE